MKKFFFKFRIKGNDIIIAIFLENTFVFILLQRDYTLLVLIRWIRNIFFLIKVKECLLIFIFIILMDYRIIYQIVKSLNNIDRNICA